MKENPNFEKGRELIERAKKIINRLKQETGEKFIGFNDARVLKELGTDMATPYSEIYPGAEGNEDGFVFGGRAEENNKGKVENRQLMRGIFGRLVPNNN